MFKTGNETSFFIYSIYIFSLWGIRLVFNCQQINNHVFFIRVGHKPIYGILWIVYNNLVLCYYIFLSIEKMLWVMLSSVAVHSNKDATIQGPKKSGRIRGPSSIPISVSITRTRINVYIVFLCLWCQIIDCNMCYNRLLPS